MKVVFKLGSIFFGISFLSFIASFVSFFFFILQYPPRLVPLEGVEQVRPSILLDDAGIEWGRFALDRRDPVTLDHISPWIVKAFVASEDRSFFSHHGLSFRGILRSLIKNLMKGHAVQGASTITQQLVRMLFLTNKKTISRKLIEQVYAVALEANYSKNEILEAYLNTVYFGSGIYGVQAACERFWGISAEEALPHHAALLAAIVRSPNRYCPLTYPHTAFARRAVVLNVMHECGFISDVERTNYLERPLALVPEISSKETAHLKELMRMHLESLLGKHALYRGGFVIQTTINSNMQNAAYQSFTDHVKKLRKTLHPRIDGGLVCLEGSTGAVKSMIGGFDFAESKIIRAVQTRQQMGSIIKPLLYAAALMNGYSLMDTKADEPFSLHHNGTLWEPRNATRVYEGTITLARALIHSNNIVTIKLLLELGYEPLCDLLRKCGITPPRYPYPALALGCIETTLLENAAMMNCFAQHGVYFKPYFIEWIKTFDGQKIFRHQPQSSFVMPPIIADQIAGAQMEIMERGRKRSNVWIDTDSFGKTGTTNDSCICSFVGSTPDFTTATSLFTDDRASLGQDAFASNTVFPVWLVFHRHVPIIKKKFSFDPSLRPVRIDSFTGDIVLDGRKKKTISILLPS